MGRVKRGDRALLVDPQTSGGLLVALPRTAVAEYLSRVEGATEIGSADPRSSFDIIIS